MQVKQRCNLSTGCGAMATCQANALSNTYGYCQRKPILYASPLAVFGFIFIPPIIGIGLFGGLGGGVVKRPILELMMNYTDAEAGGATQALMFSSSLFNIILILFQNHPEAPERPVIHFEVAMIYAIAIPVSFNIGSALAGLMPLIAVISIQMIFYFVFAPIFWFMGENERTLEEEKKDHPELLNRSRLVTLEEMKGQKIERFEEEQSHLYKQFYEESCQKFPILPLLIIFGNFALNELINLMRAPPDGHSVIFKSLNPCEPDDYYLLILLFVANMLVILIVLFLYRKKELMKNQCQFMPNERYFTPIKKFFMMYAAGFAAGFVGGFVGVAAGIIMVTSMIEFGLISRVAAASANFAYFIIGLTVFSSMLSQDSLGVGDQFFFYFLAAVGVFAFTNTGYILLNKFKIGYIICYFDFGLIVLNMLANIGFGIEVAELFGWTCGLNYVPQTCSRNNDACLI